MPQLEMFRKLSIITRSNSERKLHRLSARRTDFLDEDLAKSQEEVCLLRRTSSRLEELQEALRSYPVESDSKSSELADTLGSVWNSETARFDYKACDGEWADKLCSDLETFKSTDAGKAVSESISFIQREIRGETEHCIPLTPVWQKPRLVMRDTGSTTGTSTVSTEATK